MTNDNTTTQNEEIQPCYECEERFNINDMSMVRNRYYCHDCFEENFNYCDNCGMLFNSDEVSYCEINGDCRCNNCFIEEENQQDEEQYLNEMEIPFKVKLSDTYNKNIYKNTCGIEIECLNNNLNKNQFSYEDLKQYGFNQLTDGSLDNNGVEFSSIAFNGDLLLNKVNAFCKELNKRKYTINSSCGLHIHIKIVKTTDYLKKVFLFYSKFEDFFFNMLPKSRQDNHYCYKISMIYNEINNNLFSIDKMLDFEKKLYNCTNYKHIRQLEQEKYNNKRYCWVNFHSIFYRGTLEIRNHNGTIDNNKINNWLLIHLTALDFIKNIPLDVIKNFPKDYNLFLSIFAPELRQYIINRTLKFNPEAIKQNNNKTLNSCFDVLHVVTNGGF